YQTSIVASSLTDQICEFGSGERYGRVCLNCRTNKRAVVRFQSTWKIDRNYMKTLFSKLRVVEPGTDDHFAQIPIRWTICASSKQSVNNYLRIVVRPVALADVLAVFHLKNA